MALKAALNKIFRKKPKKNQKEQSTSKRTRRKKLKTAIGLTCVLIGFYLLVAFVSYLFTWKLDHDKVHHLTWNLLFNADLELANWLGRLGGILAHIFFFKGFGIAAFVFIALLGAIGGKLALRISSISISSVFKYGFFLLIWLPPAMSFILQGQSFPWGGHVGDTMHQWLNGFMGAIGTGALLLFGLSLFILFNFNVQLHIPNPFKKLARTSTPEEEEQDQSTDEPDKPAKSSTDEKEASPAETEEESYIDLDEQEEADKEPSSIEMSVEEASEKINKQARSRKNKKDGDDIKLDIEEQVEEKRAEDGTVVGENYDPTLDLPDYEYPTLDLLEKHGNDQVRIDKEELSQNKDQIVETLGNYKIKIEKIKATIGPTITLYEIVPEPGTRISKIRNLEDDIALSLSALGIRIIAPIPGRGTIGIEVPNKKKTIVSSRSLLGSEKFQQTKKELPITLGKTISNENFIADLAKMPHLLIAGATGQGKSVGINAFLLSLLYKKHPSQLKFVLIDPKKVELSLYKTIQNHFLAKLPNEEEPIITDTKKVIYSLNSLCMEMDERYDLLQSAQVRNIREYNKKFVNRKLNPEKGHRFLPYFVVVIDEFADFMMTAGKEVEQPIARMAQLARAVGIHLIIATQRPSVNIITGTIKANFPARIAYKVTSKVDSRTILDQAGAEQLIGSGDMLFMEGTEIVRLQTPFVDTPEVENVTDFIGTQRGYTEPMSLPEYEENSIPGLNGDDLEERDEYFEQAAQLVVQNQKGSTSLLQRKLRLGYNRAGRLMDQLEAMGIVGPQEGSKPREVKVQTEQELEQFLKEVD